MDGQRTSISKAVITLLERTMDEQKEKRRERNEYDDLDALAGSWTEREAAEFDKAIVTQRTIDPELWK